MTPTPKDAKVTKNPFKRPLILGGKPGFPRPSIVLDSLRTIEVDAGQLPIVKAEYICAAVNSHADLLAACEAANTAAEYVIGLVEENERAGTSPNPMERSFDRQALAHCYAAMAFVGKTRAAILKSKGGK